MNTKKADRPRRPYSAPILTVYGDLTQITQSAGMATTADGMTTGNTKTA